MAEKSLGQNNVTEINGFSAGDMSGIQNINDDTSLDQIADLYKGLSNQMGEVAVNAFNDVNARRNALVDNDFGSSPYLYNTYYQPAQTSTQSDMRYKGTQYALEVGLERAKQAAEDALKNAKNNYANSQTTLENLQKAKNPTAVEATAIGGNTSSKELINFENMSSYGSVDDAVNNIMPGLTSDNLVNDWGIEKYRTQADQQAFQRAKEKGLVSKDAKLEDNWNAAWWNDPDVSQTWTRTYTSKYSDDMYGQQVTQQYFDVYDRNYEIIRNYFDFFTGKVEELTPVSSLETLAIEEKKAINSDYKYLPVTQDKKFAGFMNENRQDISADEIKAHVSEEDYERLVKIIDENYGGTMDNINKRDAALKELADLYRSSVNAEGDNNSGPVYDAKAKVTKLKNNKEAFETAFGFDMESAEFLLDMKKNHRENYDRLIHDYSMVLTYGQMFEVADGNTVYHTKDGDKKIEAGEYVYYTLPGMEDDPDLKKYLELRKMANDATLTEETRAKYEEEAKKHLEAYSRTVNAAIFLTNYSDCDATESINHSAIFSKNPSSDDSRALSIFNNHTVNDVINKFNEIKNKDGEKAYRILTQIVNKASSASGTMWIRQGDSLRNVSAEDEKGRKMVGTNGEDEASFFDEGDLNNMTVDQAVALYTVLGTSMDQYNAGYKDNNVDPGFLQTGGKSGWRDWWDRTWTETAKGVVGFVDLVGNVLWSGITLPPAIFEDLAKGGDGSGNAELVFQSKRWWGWGGLTGDLTGNYSLYEQFLGDYKEGTLGYDISNQDRMNTNMINAVTPIMEDIWFNEKDDQGALGNETGQNVRVGTSSFAGFLLSVLIPELAAAGVAKAAPIVQRTVSAGASKLRANLFGTSIKMFAGEADDLVRGAAMATTDIVSNYVDDAARVVADNSDDVANVLNQAANKVDDVANVSDDLVSSINRTQRSINQTIENTDKLLASYTDDALDALGTAANSSAAFTASADNWVKYSTDVAKQFGANLDDAARTLFNKNVTDLGEQITRRTLQQAYITAYSGLPVNAVENLSDEAMDILSKVAHMSRTGANVGDLPVDAIEYLRSLKQADVKDLVREVSARAQLRSAAKGVWTADDTIRLMANHGWDTKRLSLLFRDRMKDILTDVGTDIIYGYIKPTVTNEGTDRETIDEYLTNPWNYVMNAGAYGVQRLGKFIYNRVGSTVTNNLLDRARAALDSVRDGSNQKQIEKKAARVIKLTDKAAQFADAALDKKATLSDITEMTDKTNAFVADAMNAVQEGTVRNMNVDDFVKYCGTNSALAEAINNNDMGTLRDAFASFNAASIRANANYYQYKRSMGAFANGLASVTDNNTNLHLFKAMMDGRTAYLKANNIPVGTVTMDQQKKIYRAMIDSACDYANGTIPGLRHQLEFYTEQLMKLGNKDGINMRAGYLPIESFLNMSQTDSAGIRGLSQGAYIMDVQSANPFLERSENLKDYDIVTALLNGETKLEMRDADGNVIVDELGKAVTKDLNPDGANFLDSLINVTNANIYHEYMDPILGRNGKDIGRTSLKTNQTIINAKGGQDAMMKKDLEVIDTKLGELKDKALGTSTEKAKATKAVNAAKAKTEVEIVNDEGVKKAVVNDAVTQTTAKSRIEELTARKTEMTGNKAQFIPRVMGYYDKNGNFDIDAGRKVYAHYLDVVKSDITLFQSGDISKETLMIADDYYDFTKFAWEYKKNAFGQKVDGWKQPVAMTKDYYNMLEASAKNNGEFTPDMVIRRMLDTQATTPVDANGKPLVSLSKAGKEYAWTSPLRYYDTDYYPGMTTSDLIDTLKWNRQGEVDTGWKYVDAKGKSWTRKEFESFTIKNYNDLAVAKDIYRANSVLPDNKTAKNMLDIAAAMSMVDKEQTMTFAEFVDDMNRMLADSSTFGKAFDKGSEYNRVFTNLNSLQNNGYDLDNNVREFIEAKMATKFSNGEDFTQEARAWAMIDAISSHDRRAKGLGDFDPNRFDGEGRSLVDSVTTTDTAPQLEVGTDARIAYDESRKYAEELKLKADNASKGDLRVDNSIGLINTIMDSREEFEKDLAALNKEVKLFMETSEAAEAKKLRNSALKKSGKTLDELNSLINDSAKHNVSITNAISAESEARLRRQSSYTISDDAGKNDALRAFGVYTDKDAYTVTGTPAQYRAAKSSLDIYNSNPGKIEEFESAIKVAGKASDRAEAVARRNEYIRGFNQDMSNGYNLQEGIDRLKAGTVEGRLDQAFAAAEDVKTRLQADLKNLSLSDSSKKEIKALIERAEGIQADIINQKKFIPASERVESVYADSGTDSLELSLAFTMADIADTSALDQANSYHVTKDGKIAMISNKQAKSLTGYDVKKNFEAGTFNNRDVVLNVNGHEKTISVGVNYGSVSGADEVNAGEGIRVILTNDESIDVTESVLKKVTADDIEKINDKLAERGIKLYDLDGDVPKDINMQGLYGDGRYVLAETDKTRAEYEYAVDTSKNDNLQYKKESAYNEWLAYTSDYDEVIKKIDDEIKKTEKAAKDSAKTADKATSKKVDVDGKEKEIKKIVSDAEEAQIRNKLSKEEFSLYQDLMAQKRYIDEFKAGNAGKVYRSRDGYIVLADDSANIKNYSSGGTHLNSLGYDYENKKVIEADAKADKKARKEMNKEIKKGVNKKNTDFIAPDNLDNISKKATINNFLNLIDQIKATTGLDLSPDDILINNEYAKLLERVADESTDLGKFGKFVGGVCQFSQAIQNIQLAGGASWVNALTIAQLRGAIMQDPRRMMDYIKVVGSMKDSRAVYEFAQANNELLSRIAWKCDDISVISDFGSAISKRPGVSDGGVTQNMVNNMFNLKGDWKKAIDDNIDKNFKGPRAFLDLVSKDVQDTIFEDATFKNAMPVLRAKMLTENYDAALSQLKKKFPTASALAIDDAACRMAYAKTNAFFNPYQVMHKDMNTMLDMISDNNLKKFATTFTNSKSQPTVLDSLTNFFFALRYKMMLSGRVYDGALSAPTTIKNAVKSGLMDEISDEAVNAMGTAFMHSGSLAGVGSLGACAVVAAVTASALGIPTAWDDVSFTDEYDGSFKIPDVLLKFQTIGQIWLPNAYSEEKGFYLDKTKDTFGIDTMSSIFTLQNSLFRTIDRTINPETYYAAPQRGIIGTQSSSSWINKVLNSAPLRAVGDELLGSNLLSPFKATYEVIMDSTYFGNNIWEKKYLPDGTENPNYDPGRNIAASVMHILNLDDVLDGGKGYNDWVKGKVDKNGNPLPGYTEQDQIGTVHGSGILQHEFFTAAKSLMKGEYLEAITEAGELPIKTKNFSSAARTDFNTRVKNIISSYNDDYKEAVKGAANNDQKDAAYASYVKKTADVVATWSKKYGYVLGEDQSLVPYVARTMMAFLSGEYDDNMYYVQDAYWKASKEAQIEGVTGNNYWLEDEDLSKWIDSGKTSEEFAAEKNKRTKAYNDAMDAEYEARNALKDALREKSKEDGMSNLSMYSDVFDDRYGYSDVKAEQRAVNKKVFTGLTSKLESKVGEFDNFKEMKSYYESMIDATTSTKQKQNIAEKYNTQVFDLLAPYIDEYGAGLVNDGYYNGSGVAEMLSEYVILPYGQKYYGKSPISNYIKDYFGVGYRNGKELPTDDEILEKFVTAQNLMYKGSVSSSIAVLDRIIDAIKKGEAYASRGDYSKIINMRAILSARSK